MSESCFPYTATDSPCEPCFGELTVRIDGWYRPAADPDSVKNAIFNDGPVAIILDISSDWYSYSGGILRFRSGPYTAAHAVVLVGHDDENRFWIAKNSWGTEWGEDGYIPLGYEFNEAPDHVRVRAALIPEIPDAERSALRYDRS